MFILLYCFPDFPGLQNYTELWMLLKYIPRGVMGWMSFPQNSYFIVVQSLIHIELFVTSWTAAHQASLSFTISGSLLKLTSIESVMPSNHLILCHHFSSCPQSFPASGSFPMSPGEAWHIWRILPDSGLTNKFIWLLHKMEWKNPNKLFGQPNICQGTFLLTSSFSDIFTGNGGPKWEGPDHVPPEALWDPQRPPQVWSFKL